MVYVESLEFFKFPWLYPNTSKQWPESKGEIVYSHIWVKLKQWVKTREKLRKYANLAVWLEVISL